MARSAAWRSVLVAPFVTTTSTNSSKKLGWLEIYERQARQVALHVDSETKPNRESVVPSCFFRLALVQPDHARLPEESRREFFDRSLRDHGARARVQRASLAFWERYQHALLAGDHATGDERHSSSAL